MRIRDQVVISRLSGEAERKLVLIGDNAGFAQRIAELKASVADTCPASCPAFYSLTCDGCGTIAVLDLDVPVLPPGWACEQDGDFCPRCQRAN